MNDIVERLKVLEGGDNPALRLDAIAEIERLRAELADAVKAIDLLHDQRRELEAELATAKADHDIHLGAANRWSERALKAEAERDALRQEAQRWRYWRRHFRALTTMTVAQEVGIDLSRVHVESEEDIDAVTDAARAKEGS